MSKIYDALRKAEREKKGSKKPRRSRKPGGGRKEIKNDSFLRNLDRDFQRSLMNLRNSIDSEIREKDRRVILFTSSVDGEGKTSITAGLTRILALGESNILLVDCAVNNPYIHRLFGKKNDKGIINFLAGESRMEDIIIPVEEGMLDMVTMGTKRDVTVTQPLFNSDRMEFFITNVGEHYSYVLIDSSAVLNAPETPIIGSMVDGIVMVIKAADTKREVVNRAIQAMEKQGGRLIGTVLNRKKYYIPEFIYKRV